MKGTTKLEIAAIVAAATIGEGVFALPYVIQASGWLLSLCWFVALIAAVSVAHLIYLKTLAAVNEQSRLLGLAKKYFGGTGFWTGFGAIVVGLLLGFVAYLVLGSRFLIILFPGLSPALALGIFWLCLSCVIWVSEGRIARLEIAGIVLIGCAILFIFFTGQPALAFENMPVAAFGNFFLPFGAVLFSLAGWTSVEQVYEITRRRGGGKDAHAAAAGVGALFVAGTAIAAVLYWLFALGVIGGAPHAVASDTVSGIASWPAWRGDLLAIVGIMAMIVVSFPIAREIRGALEKDLRWNSVAARLAIMVIPLAIVLAGFTNFLTIVSVVGGIFLSIQYLLIISVGRRALPLASREKVLLDALGFVFICAAVYEVAMFVVH